MKKVIKRIVTATLALAIISGIGATSKDTAVSACKKTAGCPAHGQRYLYTEKFKDNIGIEHILGTRCGACGYRV